MSGKGEFIHANGDNYFGDFKNNQRHGVGKLIYADGVYEGNFENNQKNGVGKHIFANG